jgi:FolB domain-containing protein
MDRIIISDLLVRAIIGVKDDERRNKQDIVITVSLAMDLRKPGRSDRIEDALDYSVLKKEIVSLAEGSQFFLIEALAEAIAARCLDRPEVLSATIRVEKPGALRFARTVAVEITRDHAGAA